VDHLGGAHDLEVVEGLPVSTQADRDAFAHQVQHIRPEAENGIGFSVVGYLDIMPLEDGRILPLVDIGAVEEDQVGAEEADIFQVPGGAFTETPASIEMVPAVVQVVHHVPGAKLISGLLDFLQQLGRAGVSGVHADPAGDAVIGA